MNQVMQAVNDFPWGLVALGIVIICLAYVWRKGLLGKENEDAIKARVRKMRGSIAADLAKLAAIKEPVDAGTAAVSGTLESVVSATAAPTEGDRIIRLHDAFLKGAISQEEFDERKRKILAE